MVDDFGNRVRLARARRGLTQRQLAEMTGVHQPTIAAIESGKRYPSTAVRTTLERALRQRPSEALQAHRDEVRDAITRAHGTAPMVVGSVARGTDTVDSDLDLLVTFEPHTTDLADLMGLVDELTDLTGVPVDIISGRATGRVVEHALAEAVPL